MAKIYPFRGYRYNPEKIQKPAAVVTQPYDKIPEELREEYLSRHPENVVRIIKNKNYAQAAEYWKRWIDEQVLIQDESPSFYVYSQDFIIEGERLVRTGIIGLVSLDDEDLVVRGHEKVLDQPLADRLNLIRNTEANEGLIFGLFSDSNRSIDHCLSEITQHDAEIEMVDDFGVLNRVWIVSEDQKIREIQALLQDNPLYIADGHHRYQTSVVYHQECRQQGWKPLAVESFDKRMMALFNMDSPGMRILSTHRAVKNLIHFDLDDLISKLQKNFSVRIFKDRDSFEETWERSTGIAMVTSNPLIFHLIRANDSSLEDPDFMPELEGVSRSLDVNLLHEGILAPLLGIGPDELASQKYVHYFRHRKELLEKIARSEYQLGFMLKPTTLEQVRSVSESGRKMPQKSTDFFPKLLTGLVMMKMEIDKSDEI